MLFGKKNCPNCGSEYDVASPTCPECGTRDATYQERHIASEMTFIPWWKQLVVFGIGSIGLSIIASIISMFFGKESIDLLWINFISYAVCIIGMLALLCIHYKDTLKSFKNWIPFLVGLFGAGALFLFSNVYSSIMNAIHPITDNANEATADNFIILYPGLAFFVIVLFGPVAEELTYRVGLFSLLYRVKPYVGYIITALVFGFIHFNWESFGNNEVLINELLNLPFYLFAGLLFCFLYHKWGLSASLTAHVLNNLITFILVLIAA